MFKRLAVLFGVWLISETTYSQHFSEILLELRLNNNICNTYVNNSFDLQFVIKNKAMENLHLTIALIIL